MGSICTGIGTCHRAADIVAAHNKNIRLVPVFACERARWARLVLAADFPGLRVFPDARGAAGDFPRCDVLTAGFPCQPFSAGNRRRKGSADARCEVIGDILEYISRVAPKIVIFENVPGILAWGRDVLKRIVDSLRGRYCIDFQVMTSSVHGGVPQKRRRLYIVAIATESVRQAYYWPAPIAMKPLPALLESIVDPPGSVPSAPKAAAKLRRMQQLVEQHGPTQTELEHMVVNCHSIAGKVFVGATPCLTAARSAQGGFWLLGHRRMMTVSELLRLQGIEPAGTEIATVVSARQAGLLIGNAFTLPVVGRVLVSALRTVVEAAVVDPF